MTLLPAILIGGPPGSGKSVLFHSLTRSLENCNLPSFYALRAAPDGEGHWAQEITSTRLGQLRFKGQWDQRWIDVTCRDLAARTMPLLVDVGGLPTEEQEAIFDQCTGAILLTRIDDDEGRAYWQAMMREHSLEILADLRSELHGENSAATYSNGENGAILGTLANLQRGTGQLVHGPVFDALVQRLSRVFNLSQVQVDGENLAAAPTDAQLINFFEIARRRYLGTSAWPSRWPQADLPELIRETPGTMPLAIYGAKPAWLCAGLGALRQVRYLFDVRLGWLSPPTLRLCKPGDDSWQENEQLAITVETLDKDTVRLHIRKRPNYYYLDYAAFNTLPVPFIPTHNHILLNGALPMWLFVALGQVYRYAQSVVGEQATS